MEKTQVKDLKIGSPFYSVTASTITESKIIGIKMDGGDEREIQYDKYGSANKVDQSSTTFKSKYGDDLYLNLDEAREKQIQLRGELMEKAYAEVVSTVGKYKQLVDKFTKTKN